MPDRKKRTYNSQARDTQAAQTKLRILTGAKKLFQAEGFESMTIEKLAGEANVSAPTIYAIFQSKRGILRALMDESLPSDQFKALAQQAMLAESAEIRLAISAKMARQIYDAEREQMDIFRGAAVLAPEFKEFERERELRRYDRQEDTIKAMVKEKSLAIGLSVTKARDILWAFTGRDMYRMFVVEQGWKPAEYEKWLAQLLIKSLVQVQ